MCALWFRLLEYGCRQPDCFSSFGLSVKNLIAVSRKKGKSALMLLTSEFQYQVVSKFFIFVLFWGWKRCELSFFKYFSLSFLCTDPRTYTVKFASKSGSAAFDRHNHPQIARPLPLPRFLSSDQNHISVDSGLFVGATQYLSEKRMESREARNMCKD